MTSSLDIIKLILDTEMQMPPNRVWAFNADMDLPQDQEMFIVLRSVYKSPTSNNVKYIYGDNKVNELQTMNVAEDILISVMSKNTDARDRAYEVQMALGSTFSQQQQEKNKMHISRIGEVFDASFLEATSRLNRYDVRCRVLNSYTKTKEVDYYTKFPVTSTFEPEWHFDV